MNTALRAVISILTALTVIALVVFTILGIVIKQPLLVVVCALLTFGFGMFSYNDVRYWINFFKQKK